MSAEKKKELAEAVERAEDWMKKAPYLCYDLAKELIEAAKEVLDEHGTRTV